MGWLFGALNLILGFLGYGKKADKPKAEERVGRAEANLSNMESANVELQAAARARAASDAERLRNDPRANEVFSDPTASINRDPHGHYRD